MDPRGKIVIITGASSGIGAAAARAFAAAGASVTLAARSGAELERLAAELPEHPLVVPTDVRSASAARALVERVIAERGQVDILINNAGIGLAGPVATLDTADLEHVLAVNLLGSLHTIQAAVPHMCQRGQGQIINVSSVVGRQALPYLGGYAASKAALDRLTEALRMELRGTGIVVTLVRPGTTRTEFRQRRLGRGQEQRRVAPRGVPPAAVAQVLLRAAYREPHTAYVTVQDRILVLLSTLLPRVAEGVLARSFRWEEAPP